MGGMRVKALKTTTSVPLYFDLEKFQDLVFLKCCIDEIVEEDGHENDMYLGLTSVRDMDGFEVYAARMYILGWESFRSWILKVDLERIAKTASKDYSLPRDAVMEFLTGMRGQLEDWQIFVDEESDSLDLEFWYN